MIVWWRGVQLDERTAAMMDAVADLCEPTVKVEPSQGSYSGSVDASANTHSRGGAVDCMNLTGGQWDVLVRQMRKVGFAAWHRTPDQSNWPHHVHAIAVQPGGKYDQGCLSAQALAQVVDYYDNRNGLASGAPDDGPRDHVGTTWETYQQEADMLSEDDLDRIAARVLRGLKWAWKGGETPQNLQQHITELRRDTKNTRTDVKGIKDELT